MSDDLDLTFNDSPSATKPCPKCGAEMNLRRNRETGDQFWGCTAYPDCKGSAPLYEPDAPDTPYIFEDGWEEYEVF